MLHVLAAADPSLVVAVIAATGAIVAGVFSMRSKVSADLVDDVMADRTYLRAEVDKLRGEVDTLKANARETERALIACRENEQGLRAQISRLEASL